MHDYTPLLDSSQLTMDECKSSKIGSRKDKYALRERQKRRLGLASVVDLPKRSNHRDEIDTTAGQQRTQNNTTPKSKAPPLSKYRRKTANARERTRMREINSAFENLRHCVPQSIAVEEAGPANEKLTKITTLRLAMKYIGLLTEVLNNPNFKGELPLDFLYANYTESIIRQEAATPTQPIKVDRKSAVVASKSRKQPSKSATAQKTKSAVIQKPPKRLGKRKKKDSKITTASQPSNSLSSNASIGSASSSSFVTCSGDSQSSRTSSFLDSITSPSYSSNYAPAMSELNNLTLESDGESLHLSDPCHSPIQEKYDRLFGNGDLNARSSVEHTILGDIDAPLELSLQFLGTTPESLDFSMEQPPTTCISPLVALDSFNPFSDFLHEYPEQSSLDLFLT